MKNFKKKYSVKIPNSIQVVYCDQKNIITFVGPLSTKSLKLPVKLFLLSDLSTIIVSRLSSKGNLSVESVKKLQGTTLAKIKQVLIEITYVLHQKLNLVGVGYRAFLHEKLSNQIYFKLGYSHFIYFRIPMNVDVYCLKLTKLFIFGKCSYDNLTQLSAQIRSCKVPEPYKGKGILYDQEQVILKKGKKV